MNSSKKTDNEVKFIPVIIGTDINAYSMARNFYEAYAVKSFAIGRVAMPATSTSKLLTIQYENNLGDAEVFLKTLIEFAKKHKEAPLILVGATDQYVRLIVENREELSKYYLFNCVEEDLLNSLLVKDVFYTKYASYGISIPKTYIYSCEEKNKKIEELNEKELASLGFPIILKPGNGIEYHNHSFESQAKVYKFNDMQEVKRVVKLITDAGYRDKLIFQQYIAGDDSFLFDVMFYASTKGKVEFMTFAQIGLQEHTPTGIGNCTVLINGYNQYGNTNKITKRLKEFIEKIGYKGPGEVDIKYDLKSKEFKVLEINPRQGRCCYYATASGFNLAKYLVEDLLLNKIHEYKLSTSCVALSFVPFSVLKAHTKNKEMVEKLKQLKKNKKIVNPLVCKEDMNLKRAKWLCLRKINYCKKYKNNQW